MDFRDGRVLGSRLVGALTRIAADRLQESRARSLPRTKEQLADPDVLNELIRNYTPAGQTPLPPLRAVRLPGIDFESSNCTNFLLELEFENAAGHPVPLPKTIYAKLPCAELSTRAFAGALGFWEVEAVFCQRVSTQVPIRVPRVHVAAMRGARFVLLLENLQEARGTQLFINRDMAAGTTPERARSCLRTFAELHAGFWGWAEAEREALLPRRLQIYLAPGGREMTRALSAMSIGPAHKAAPEIFGKEHVALCKQATQKWDALVDTWYSDPLTLIHGDSHLGNCFEYASSKGPRMGMLDFQATHWCQGIRDVQYFLINSLEPKVLAEHEDALVDFYLQELLQRGVSLPAEDAREQYRALSFQTLMVAVTSIGLGSLTERDETVRTVLRRSVAAIDRLRFGDWLDTL